MHRILNILKKGLTRDLFFYPLVILLISSCGEDAQSNKKNNPEEIYNGIRKNYLDGKLASTVTYKDSVKNGVAINYYPSGKVNMEFNYKNDEKDGAYKWYFENGKLYLEGIYLKGKKNGIFKTYRKDGSLKSEMPWIEGLPCTGLKEYSPSGKLKPTPKILVKEVNTVKLNGECSFHLSLSNKSKKVKFYEAKLGDNRSFDAFFPGIKGKKGKAKLTKYIPRGTYLMQTLSIIAYQKTKDKNIYVIQKKLNVAIENR